MSNLSTKGGTLVELVALLCRVVLVFAERAGVAALAAAREAWRRWLLLLKMVTPFAAEKIWITRVTTSDVGLATARHDARRPG